MSPTDEPQPSPGDAAGGDALAPETPADDTMLLSARGIRKAFGQNEVLRGVDLEVRRGEVVALIGPSGSGKTTVLRSLNGLETPDAGSIEVDGGPSITFGAPGSKADRFALRDRSAMVFQHHNLFPHMTVLQNVIEGPTQVQRVPKAQAINKIGHALHDRDPVFDRFSRDPRLAALVADLGMAEPLLLQSMLIFKQPRIGGEVVWHQDASFLITWLVYPLGILASCFHLANGFWTAAITWGLTVSRGAQRRWGFACAGLFAVTFIAAMLALVAAARLDPNVVPLVPSSH